MNYKQLTILTGNQWNNALSFDKRTNKSLWIPWLKRWTIDDLKQSEKIVFEDFKSNGELISATWLENFLQINDNIYIMDNHNHALYFWYKALNEWVIDKWATLIHIDQHSDMNEPQEYIDINHENDLDYIWEFVNFKTNVWNYIIPWLRSWLIKEIIQIRTETALKQHLYSKQPINTIVNIDMDFRAPELSHIDEKLKNNFTKNIISKYIKNRKWLITIATSPFFINQNMAIEKIKEISLHCNF